MNWSFDLSQAPKGRMVKRTQVRTVKGMQNQVETEVFEPDFIIAATNCNKVIKSYWVPANGRHNGYWSGFPIDPKYGPGPVAWAPWPEHPLKNAEDAA